MATINEMRQVATQIENETQVGGNTASRVGGLFNDVVDKLEVVETINANEVVYANSQSGLAAENVQGALDESSNKIGLDGSKTVVYAEDYNLEYLKKQGYIALNGSTASLTPIFNDGWRCVVCPCESYDVFEVTGYGGNSSRVYGFLDSNLNVIRVAAAEQYKLSFRVAAPYGSAYFIANGVNNDVSYQKLSVIKLQKGSLELINEHELCIKGSYDAMFEMGSGDTSNFNLVESVQRLRMCRPMPILDGASYTLNVGFNIGYYYVVFYYLNNVGVSYVKYTTTINGNHNIEVTPSSNYDSFRVIVFPSVTHTFTNAECVNTHLIVVGQSLDGRIAHNGGQFQVPFNINSDYWEQGNIDGSTGVNITSTNAIRTFSYIAVEYGQVWHYSMNGSYRLAFLFFRSKSSDGYISVKQWLTGSGDVTIPTNAKYIRLVIAAPSGSSNLPVFNAVGLSLVCNKKMIVSDFAADAGYYELLGNNDIVWENGAIDTSSGYNVQQNNRIRTKYAYKVGKNFYIGANTNYWSMAILYDAYGNVVNRDGLLTTTRLYQTHDEYYVRFVIGKRDNSPISVDEFDLGDVIIPVATPNAHTYNYGIDFNADNVTVAEVYRHLHDVTFRHSSYITETTLGLDASGDYEIRAYALGSGSKKIFIVGGQHGPQSDPWDSVITITRFITQLADTTYDTDFADHLRDEYTLYIVPMCNPYGLDHYNVGQDDQTAFIGGRHNYNGVNLNRDWGVFSQPETTLVNTFMLSVQPDAVMDVHTLGDTYTTGTASERGRVYLSSGNSSIRNDFSGLFSTKLMKYYNCGTFVDNNTTSTTLKQYAETTLSVYGMTIECDWWIWGVAEPHSSEMESANMALLVNAIKMFTARIESLSYVYEKVPKQSQAS